MSLQTGELLNQAGTLTESNALNYIVAGQLTIIIGLLTIGGIAVKILWNRYWAVSEKNDKEKREFSEKILSKLDNHDLRLARIEIKLEK